MLGGAPRAFIEAIGGATGGTCRCCSMNGTFQVYQALCSTFQRSSKVSHSERFLAFDQPHYVDGALRPVWNLFKLFFI